MSDIAKAMATQLANIEKRTGKSLAELAKLKRDLGMGHGDANSLVHHVKSAGAPPAASPDAALDAICSGPKAALRQAYDEAG